MRLKEGGYFPYPAMVRYSTPDIVLLTMTFSGIKQLLNFHPSRNSPERSSRAGVGLPLWEDG